ncbi:MAG: cytochrome ubiquinol oxidase subunit I [Chloroflexi bacterium]|nr:MAG: cytochrome ubiquinol oxidase subunit I [Chloroflexota bacterium]
MDTLTLARWQFGITTVYHFFFVPLTLGLSLLVAILQTIYYRTGDETYKKMTKFWGKLFLINFAMGVVTGIVQEFQFGMNWSEFSRFVGDIFGVPLAIEALLAFFMESTFLGLWVFGWDKLPKRIHLATIWLVALGSNLSALWILIANSFMQEPVGYVLRSGRAELVDFLALVLNPHLRVQFPHVFFSGMTTAGFFVIAISAYHLFTRSPHKDFFRRSFSVGVIYGLIGVVSVVLIGHTQTQHLVQTQPMKVAAAEALWESESPAAMSLFTIGNEPELRDVFAIKVPGLLSFLAYNRFEGEVKGIKNIQAEYEQIYGPGNYIPPVAVSYWTFRIMVGSGMAMALLALYSLYLILKNRVDTAPPLVLKALLLAGLLPYVANSTGWLFAEIARQPWIVHGLMRVEEAVSPAVTAGELWVTLIGFTLLYGVLMVADIYLLVKFARRGPTDHPDEDALPDVPAGSPAVAHLQ